MEPNRLDSFQREVLKAFFARESRFFLTGGAALVGYYLGHRTTQDLDLFTTEDLMEDGLAALTASAREIGATLEPVRTSPDFRRFLLRRGEEALVVDLVRDSAPQVFPDKPMIGGIRVDPPEEILANKLCTLLSRSEIRDLVDVRALEQKGFSIEHAFPLAMQKDGGLTPGQLAWVLSGVRIGNDANPPGDVSVNELREYLEDLRHRLATLAFPPL
ncbi:MAG TPA: nucleotidyl transferase AbiEii/AbiGii toxin family protein [Thermoanaerobaculia bacterium]|nr:nucleotidyl transferase AbiEii/AbiGii toxin family protein [Thermoanaerobaculia bacterium]